jgi:hypothetical protein
MIGTADRTVCCSAQSWTQRVSSTGFLEVGGRGAVRVGVAKLAGRTTEQTTPYASGLDQVDEEAPSGVSLPFARTMTVHCSCKND